MFHIWRTFQETLTSIHCNQRHPTKCYNFMYKREVFGTRLHITLHNCCPDDNSSKGCLEKHLEHANKADIFIISQNILTKCTPNFQT